MSLRQAPTPGGKSGGVPFFSALPLLPRRKRARGGNLTQRESIFAGFGGRRQDQGPPHNVWRAGAIYQGMTKHECFGAYLSWRRGSDIAIDIDIDEMCVLPDICPTYEPHTHAALSPAKKEEEGRAARKIPLSGDYVVVMCKCYMCTFLGSGAERNAAARKSASSTESRQDTVYLILGVWKTIGVCRFFRG